MQWNARSGPSWWPCSSELLWLCKSACRKSSTGESTSEIPASSAREPSWSPMKESKPKARSPAWKPNGAASRNSWRHRTCSCFIKRETLWGSYRRGPSVARRSWRRSEVCLVPKCGKRSLPKLRLQCRKVQPNGKPGNHFCCRRIARRRL